MAQAISKSTRQVERRHRRKQSAPQVKEVISTWSAFLLLTVAGIAMFWFGAMLTHHDEAGSEVIVETVQRNPLRDLAERPGRLNAAIEAQSR